MHGHHKAMPHVQCKIRRHCVMLFNPLILSSTDITTEVLPAGNGKTLHLSSRHIAHLRCSEISGAGIGQSRPCEQQAHVSASRLGKPGKLQQPLGAVRLLLPHPIAICAVLLHNKGKG